jgi:hypothetical protein
MSKKLNIGDYVEIVNSTERYGGKRAYVKMRVSNKIVVVALDDSDYYLYPESRIDQKCRVDDLKLLRRNEEAMTTRVCDVVSGEYACLGRAVSPTNHEPLINPDSPRGRLPRPPIETMPRKRFTFDTPETEAVFTKIYGGDFIAVWRHQLTFTNPHEPSRKAPEPTFHIEVFVEQEEADNPLKVGELKYLPVTFDEHRVNGEECPQRLGWNDWNPKYAIRRWEWTALPWIITTKQRTALSLRVIHLLVRVAGYDIGNCARYAFEQIFNHFMMRGEWADAVDAAIILGDMAILTKQTDLVHYRCCYHLNSSLVCNGMFRHAAGVMGQCATDYATITVCDKIDLLTRKGTALFSDRDFDASLDAYLTAFRRHFETHGDGTFVQTCCKHMLTLTSKMTELFKVRHRVSGPTPTDDAALLFIACAKASGITVQFPQGVTDLLQPALVMNDRLAQGALRYACTRQSIDDFHDAIRLLKRDGLQSVPVSDFYASPELTTPEEEYKEALSLVQDYYKTEYQRECPHLLFPCDNPACTALRSTSNLLHCRCATAQYCRKDCQKDAWRTHKLVCPWQRNP